MVCFLTHELLYFYSSNDALISLLLSMGLSLVAPDTLGTAEVITSRRIAGLSAPVHVQRLSSIDMMNRGITDIGDAMRRMSGVNLRDYGGAGGLKTVSVRGMGASHTAVTYDGLPVSDTRQGQIDMGQFSTDRLSGIALQTLDNEELLCPVRLMSAALVSLEGLWNTHSDKRWHGSVGMRQASFSTYNPSLTLDKRITPRVGFSMGQDYFLARNDYPFTIKNGVATANLRRNNSRMVTSTSELNLRYTPQRGELRIKAYFSHNYRHLPGMVRYYVNQNNERLTEENAFGQAQWKMQSKRLRCYASAKYNWQKSLYNNIDAQYPGGVLRQHYWQRETYATTGLAYFLTPHLQTAYSTDFAYASLNSNLSTDRPVGRHTWLQAISMQYKSHRFTLIARGINQCFWNEMRGGTSAKDASRITPTLTASVMLLNQPLWLYLRAGYKESFRMPTFTESYYYHLGSKTLNPELARQVSVGTTLQASPSSSWWPMLALTIDGYSNRISDKIVSIPYNLFVWQTVNMGIVRTKGIDATLQSRWQFASRNSLLFVSKYSLQQSRDCSSPSLSTWHKQLAYTPLHSGSSSLTWENQWLSFVVHTTFASKRWCTNNHLPTTDLPPYNEWGISLFRTFAFKQSHLLARFDLQNVFDQRYEIIGSYPMPGRAFKITLNYSF